MFLCFSFFYGSGCVSSLSCGRYRRALSFQYSFATQSAFCMLSNLTRQYIIFANFWCPKIIKIRVSGSGSPRAAANPAYYFGASGVSALAFFPLWKAGLVGWWERLWSFFFWMPFLFGEGAGCERRSWCVLLIFLLWYSFRSSWLW